MEGRRKIDDDKGRGRGLMSMTSIDPLFIKITRFWCFVHEDLYEVNYSDLKDGASYEFSELQPHFRG